MPDIQKIVFVHKAKTVIDTQSLAPSSPAVVTYFFLFLIPATDLQQKPNLADIYFYIISPSPEQFFFTTTH